MTNLPPLPLTTTAQRARAAAMLSSALDCQTSTAFALIETVDAVSAAVLHTASVHSSAARGVLAVLWDQPLQATVVDLPSRTLRRTDREREFLRALGERIHVTRQTSNGNGRAAGTARVTEPADTTEPGGTPEAMQGLEQDLQAG